METFNPYRAPESLLFVAEGEGELVLARRGTRLAAAIADGIAMMVAILPALLFFMVLSPKSGGETAVGFTIGLLCLGALLALNLTWLHRYGQSVGKRLFHIRILRCDGTPISLGRIFLLRWLPLAIAGGLPYIGNFIGLVDTLMIFRSSRKCLHDEIADTFVVETDGLGEPLRR